MRAYPRHAAAAAAVLVLAGTAAGCGGKDQPDPQAAAASTAKTQITQVIARLQAASVAGAGRRICTDLFTPKLADSVTQSAASGSCAEEVRSKLFSPDTSLTVQDVSLSDATDAVATVKERSGSVSKVYFARQSGVWRIRSVQPS